MSTDLVDRTVDRLEGRRTLFVPDERNRGRVGTERQRIRPLAFSVPLALATFLVALLIDFRRGQGWFGDLLGAILRDAGGAITIGLASYLLQRSVEGQHFSLPKARARRQGSRRPAPKQPPGGPWWRRSWQAPGGVPLARTWSVLVAWGWLLQLRVLPDRSGRALIYLVLAHLAFAVTVPIGSYLRTKCSPPVDPGGPDAKPDRSSVYLRLVAISSLGLGVLLLWWVLARGGVTGDARVSVNFLFLSVQPAEPARAFFIVAFAAAISGARLSSDQAWRWWDARLPLLRIPASTVVWGGFVAIIAGGLFLRLNDMSPFLVTMVSFVLIVLLVLPVARIRFALLLFLALAFALPLVTGTKLDDRYAAKDVPIPLVGTGEDAAYAPVQLGLAIIAEERGLPTGTGIGQGVAAEVVPAAHNDFILAVLVEEWGLIGIVGVCALYALLLWRAFGMALRSSIGFGQTLAVALVVSFATQLVYVVAGLARWFPHGGLTVPMLSAGGSSLIVTGALFGTVVGTAANRVEADTPIPVRAGRHTGLAGRTRMVRIVAVALVWVLGGAALIMVPLNTVSDAERDLAALRGPGLETPPTSSWIEEQAQRRSVRRPTIRTREVDGKSTVIAVTSGDVACGGYTSPVPFQATLGSSAGPLVRCYPQRTLYSDVLGYYTPSGGLVRGLEQVVGGIEACTPASGVVARLAGPGACGEVREVEVTIHRDTQIEAQERLTVAKLVEEGTIANADAGRPFPVIAATIVSDPATGDIEALTSTPSYDPNARARPRAVAAQGRSPYTFEDATLDLWPENEASWDAKALFAASQYYSPKPEPGLPLAAGELSAEVPGHPMGEPVSRSVRFAMGSTMKLVVSVAALEADRDAYRNGDGQKIAALALKDREETVQAPGLQGGNDDGGPCGGSLSTMLAESCNTGFSLLAQVVGRDQLLSVAERLGVAGDQPANRLDGLRVEQTQALFPKSKAELFGSQAIGLQGTDATVIDMAGVVNTIAQSGTKMPWRLVDPEDCAERRVLGLAPCADAPEPLVDPAIADQVRSAMELTVSDPKGTAHDALFGLLDEYHDVGLELAAKTGSASASFGEGQQVGWCVVIARWSPDGAAEPQQRTFVTAVQGPNGHGIDGPAVCKSVEPLIKQVVGAP